MSRLTPRKGMPSPRLNGDEFRKRFLAQFQDPAFDSLGRELDSIAAAAWDAYSHSRPAPACRSHQAGHSAHQLFVAQRAYLSRRNVEVLSLGRNRARGVRRRAGRCHRAARPQPPRFGIRAPYSSLQGLLLHGRRPLPLALLMLSELFTRPDARLDERDLPDVGRGPRHHDYYARELVSGLVAAQADDGPSRLCGRRQSRSHAHARQGRGAGEYPRHLAGRLFSVVVHGDVEGVENVRRSISDWLCFMHLCAAGPMAELDRYIGYWKPYATSHANLDADSAVQEEVRNAARTLLEAVRAKLEGKYVTAGEDLREPRQK